MRQESFQEELLAQLGKRLGEYGLSVQKTEAVGEEGEGLRCFFNLYERGEDGQESREGEPVRTETGTEGAEGAAGRPKQKIMVVELDFMELGALPVLQYYFYMQEDLTEAQKEALRPLIEENNAVMPLGHMGILEGDLYFRYSQVFSEEEDMEAAVGRCEDTLSLLIMSLQINMEDIYNNKEKTDENE